MASKERQVDVNKYLPEALHDRDRFSKYLQEPDKYLTESQINCFGNFAMIGAEANSSGSNWTPKSKLDHYMDPKSNPVSVASLKFRIMMQVCQDNIDSKKRTTHMEWDFSDIQKHQNNMLNILFSQNQMPNVNNT